MLKWTKIRLIHKRGILIIVSFTKDPKKGKMINKFSVNIESMPAYDSAKQGKDDDLEQRTTKRDWLAIKTSRFMLIYNEL